MRACIVGLLLFPIATTAAATLRPLGTVAGASVHVADLWDDAGAAGARVLGPAPAPGGRITVGAAQLAAIAGAYGVDWRPGSDADQAVLNRPGTPLPIQIVLAALRPALAAQGAGAGDATFDIALPLFDPPMLDSAAVPRITIEQTNFDPGSSRFSAVILVSTAEGDPQRLRLSGSVATSVAVAVPTRRLLPGTVLAAGDLVIARVRANTLSVAVVLAPSQAYGQELRHLAMPGQPVPVTDLRPPMAVAKGDRVMMALALPGLDLGALGVALEAGAVGQAIAVRNPVSGAILTADITGPDQVRVDADHASVHPPAGGYTVASR